MAFHRDLTGADVHTPITFIYADETARTSATGLTSQDIGKLAWQQDNNSFWILTAITPAWTSVLGGAVLLSDKGVPNGVAELDGSGKVPTSQLPSLAITDVHVVPDNTARDALTVQTGDVAKVTADNKTYIWDGSQWIEITVDHAVDSVNGQTGAVILDTDDISEGTSNLYYTDTKVSANSDVAANTAARHDAATVQDTSDIDMSITGQEISADLTPTGVTPGNYTNPSFTVDSKGRVTAAASGSSGVLYGDDFNLFESLGITVTTSTTPNNKLSGTTSILPVGKYKIAISYNWSLDDTGSDFKCAASFDGVFLGEDDGTGQEYIQVQEAKDSGGGNPDGRGTNQSHGFTRIFFVDVVSAGAKDIDLFFRPSTGGVEASMWGLVIEIIRVQ